LYSSPLITMTFEGIQHNIFFFFCPPTSLQRRVEASGVSVSALFPSSSRYQFGDQFPFLTVNFNGVSEGLVFFIGPFALPNVRVQGLIPSLRKLVASFPRNVLCKTGPLPGSICVHKID